MDASASEHDPLAPLADEFLDRCRRGERLSAEDYARLHPELASQIREVFPALMVMEGLGGSIAHAEPVPAPACPPRLGEYRILRQVGRGGMGVVYEAVQETLGRHVALKVLPPAAAGQGTYLERFRREARAAARLHHTHVVPVFGVGECDGTHYYAMQFIHGQGLDRVLDDVRRLRAAPPSPQAAPPSAGLAQSLLTACYQPSDARTERAGPDCATAAEKVTVHSGGLACRADRYHLEVARLGAQAADALAYAHSQGVLHRDVKPSNLLLDAEGALWVTDFGLAKADDGDDLTDTGDVVGTLRYMAPERFDGKADARSDVYGLGVTLFEMLALRPAFDDRDRAALIRRITQEGPPRLRPFAPSVPRDLDTIVNKACARDPADRYQTAADLAEDLRRFLSDRPIRARRQRLSERARRWARRNPALAGLGAAVALLAVALLTVGVFYNVHLKRALGEEAHQRGRAEAAEREARLKLFESRVAEARASRHSRRVGQRYRTLEAIREAAALARELGLAAERFDELRNLAIAALALPDLRPDSAVVSVPDDMGEVWNGKTGGEVSPDGRLTAFFNADGDVRVCRVGTETEDGGEVARFPDLGRGVTLCWSPDSRHLAVWHWSTGKVRLWRISDRALTLEAPTPGTAGPAFSPDGRRMVVAVPDAVRVYDLERYELERAWPAQGGTNGWVAHHPHRPEVAVTTRHGIDVIDLETGQVITRLPAGPRAEQPAWHPQGELLSVSFFERVEIWDVPRRRRNHSLLNPGGGVHSRFDPTGDLLVTWGWQARVRLWNPYTGREVLSAFGQPAGFRDADRLTMCFPDARSPRRSPLTVVEAGREYRTLLAGLGRPVERNYRRCRAHPDGRLLVAMIDGGFSLMDLATGSERAFVPGKYEEVSFEPGGGLLTMTHSGLFRWPVRGDGDRLRVGPPQRVPVSARSETVAHSADGSVMAAADFAGATVWRRDRPRESRRFGPHPDCRHVAVSPDGELVATGSWSNQEGINVWDSQTGELRRNLSRGTSGTAPAFSPDGRWLYNVTGRECWRVSDWSEGARPPAGVNCAAFSPDGKLAAWGGLRGSISLVDPQSGRELAVLEDPSQDGTNVLSFTPDGTALLGGTSDSGCVRVWDLRLIRKGLVELGLDWDAPPYPPAPDRPPPDRPLAVEVVGAELLDDPKKLAEHERQRAVADLYFNPFDADAHESLGRHLLGQKKYAEARAHLGVASSLQPDRRSAWLPRGIAAFRLGRYREARDEFTRHLGWRPDDGEASFWRGSARARLDEHGPAIDDFTEALRRGAKDTPGINEARAAEHLALKQHAEAAADFETALKMRPNNARVLVKLAVLRANGPACVRDRAGAVRLAERAVKLLPKDPVGRRALGIALYRAGRHKEGAAALGESLELGRATKPPTPKAATLYYLAMCQAGLGDREGAKRTFDKAAAEPIDPAWPPAFRERLKEIRAEAEAELRATP